MVRTPCLLSNSYAHQLLTKLPTTRANARSPPASQPGLRRQVKELEPCAHPSRIELLQTPLLLRASPHRYIGPSPAKAPTPLTPRTERTAPNHLLLPLLQPRGHRHRQAGQEARLREPVLQGLRAAVPDEDKL